MAINNRILMRIIEYKDRSSNQFFRHIDIGSCEKNFEILPLFNEENTSYETWYLDFMNLPMGVQMLTIHYYLLEYNSDGFVPDILKNKISVKFESFNNFNNKWFVPDAPFFKGLDLNWEDVEEQITDTKVNDQGIRTEIEFKDGSRIRFLDENDYISSFYVLEQDFSNLKLEWSNILNALK